MKNIAMISIAILMLVLSSCEYDNYDEPSVVFNGRLTTNGDNFLYDGNQGVLKVIQKGFGKVDNGIYLRVDESGKFQQLLFPGEYWLTLNNVKYPFEFEDFHSLGSGLGYDSLYMNINSNITKNFEVKPYFNISNFRATVEGDNIVLRADVAVNTGTRETPPRVIFARGYVGTASIVSSRNACTKSKRAVITTTGSVEVTIPIHNDVVAYRTIYVNNFRDYAFCRIALELDGIQNYYLFSETVKVEGVPQ